jgi:hypothetical protein
MDYFSDVLCFCAGLLISYLIFHVPAMFGKFEKLIWSGLHEGKRVIVSLDEDAYIFVLVNNKLRITQGVVDFIQELPNGVALADSDSDKSDDDDTVVL